MNHEALQVVVSLHALGWIATGAILGTIVTIIIVGCVLYYLLYHQDGLLSELYARDRRRCLPRFIILVRHGESEANLDKQIWQHLPDNLVALTARGQAQATAVGQRVAALLQSQTKHPVRRIHLIVSPFERALQTAACMRPALRHCIVRTDIESRIREQEMGNLQGEEFNSFRAEQTRVGRFWYRFPTGESGSDVLDRVKSWWYESVLTVNTRAGFAPVDALVVVTHGLTMRFILMQLFGWSPTTFHSVWNADNCSMYVLERDLTKPGASPYVLDKEHGDMPRSSIDVVVQLKNKDTKLALKLNDYLSVPPPRTTRIGLIGQMLALQYPDKITSPDEIAAILFMPFSEGGIIKGRSTSGLGLEGGSSSTSSELHPATQEAEHHDDDDDDDDELNNVRHIKHIKPEMSLRFPCIQLAQEGLQNVESPSSRRFRFFQNERHHSTPDSLFDSQGDDNDDNVNESDHNESTRCTAKNLENNAEQDEFNATSASNRKRSFFRFPPFTLPGLSCIEGELQPSQAAADKKYV